MILAAKESEHLLIADLFHKVDEIRHKVATTINTGITLMHWHIGEHINKNILHEKRAEYGKNMSRRCRPNCFYRKGALRKAAINKHPKAFQKP